MNKSKSAFASCFAMQCSINVLAYRSENEQRNVCRILLRCLFYGSLGVSVLGSGTRIRGFKLGRSLRIFRAKKILSTPSFGGEVKPSVPCRTLRHVKDPKMAWKSPFRLNLPGNILAHSSTLRY